MPGNLRESWVERTAAKDLFSLITRAHLAAALLISMTLGVSAQGGAYPTLRPPATPLIVHDPYFSVWSMSDRLTDGPTKHWTGVDQPLNGIVRIDGVSYRFLGANGRGGAALPVLQEAKRTIMPTRTIVVMTCDAVELTMEFLTPAFPDDVRVLARPVTYVTWQARSRDGREHSVALYFDAAGSLATNDPGQQVLWSRGRLKGLDLLRVGTAAQPVLQRFGDNVRIDWGWFYIAVPQSENAQTAAGNQDYLKSFVSTGQLPESDDIEGLRTPQSRHPPAPTLNVVMPFGKVGTQPMIRHLLVAYDDVYSIEYMHRKLLPYWHREFPTFGAMLEGAEEQYHSLRVRAQKYDDAVDADLTNAGGPEYAAIGNLAFRQALGAQKLVEDSDGTALLMPKENFSNGSISTVDVIYPSAPMLLLFNPRLVEAQLEPVLRYADSERWKFPFAPHDLGIYPQANGQLYGGGEESSENQMPVEESANILLLAAAIAQAENDGAFAAKHWPALTRWAEYLLTKGLDPENQLSTDDFSGHLAHNANLSIKAIEALGAYSQLARRLGKSDLYARYDAAANRMVVQWMKMAGDGDHYRLAFDVPGSWSQKYNLIWDTILGMNLFPSAVRKKEVRFYLRHINAYGIPLDGRATYTKLDWEVWTAALSKERPDFETMVRPVFRFLNETDGRVPMADWYDTTTAAPRNFRARSVVGAIFIRLLQDSAVWKKWAELSVDRQAARPENTATQASQGTSP